MPPLTCLFGPACSDLLARTCLLGPACSDLLARTCLFGPACSDLLARTCLFGPACSDLPARTCLLGPACSDLPVRTCLFGPACSDLPVRTCTQAERPKAAEPCRRHVSLRATARQTTKRCSALVLHRRHFQSRFHHPLQSGLERLKLPYLTIRHLQRFLISRVFYTLSHTVNQRVAFLPFCAFQRGLSVHSRGAFLCIPEWPFCAFQSGLSVRSRGAFECRVNHLCRAYIWVFVNYLIYFVLREYIFTFLNF